MMRALMTLALLLITATAAQAQGMVIAPDGRPAPLELRHHRVDANIEDQVAVVTVTHEFHNPGRSVAEGTFLFPLPKDAQVSRFSMEVDGQEMMGELLDANEARRIYEDIVRRSLDPALLEMADYRTFRARVFPIPGGAKRTITLRYDVTLPFEAHTATFQYPLQGALSTRTIGRPVPEPIRRPRAEGNQRPRAPHTHSLIRLHIQSQAALKNLYSPSHAVDIDRRGNKEAVVTMESTEGLDGHDFILYYSLDPRDIGATMLTHRPYRDRPGYFMMLLAPPFEVAEEQVQRKDVVFVLDTSGSMRGEKLDQAKEALRYALDRLGERDRFGLVAFSSDADPFRARLASPEACDDARFFVDQLEARGGTNINEALLAALKMLDGSEQGMIVFLTDGLPSTGVTDEGQIRTNIAEANATGVRLFSFGVGYDVNTRLLDGLSATAGAFADYISPDENIEERISVFYEKVRYPVMTDISFKLEGIEGHAFAPRALPDLYKGGQLILAGRYRKPGKATLTLRGRIGERQQVKRYTFEFPEVERERDFVARLWATRRVGQLLDEIRLKGENDELKEEIIALAKEFGLVTPYTSYLVQEEEVLVADESLDLQLDVGPPPPPSAEARPPSAEAMRQTSGAAAVQMSRTLRDMQEADVVATPGRQGLLSIQGRTLRLTDEGAWVDTEFDLAKDTPIQVKFASDAYFTLLRLYPDTRAFAERGDQLVFKFRNHFIQIGPEGKETMTEAEWRALLE